MAIHYLKLSNPTTRPHAPTHTQYRHNYTRKIQTFVKPTCQYSSILNLLQFIYIPLPAKHKTYYYNTGIRNTSSAPFFNSFCVLVLTGSARNKIEGIDIGSAISANINSYKTCLTLTMIHSQSHVHHHAKQRVRCVSSLCIWRAVVKLQFQRKHHPVRHLPEASIEPLQVDYQHLETNKKKKGGLSCESTMQRSDGFWCSSDDTWKEMIESVWWG